MPKSIDPSKFADALSRELSLYAEETIEEVNAAGERAIKKLVKLTKKTAPRRKKNGGSFAKSITHTVVEKPTGDKEFVWGAKAPHHRLTHLLVKGHATVNGDRVPGDPFLENALETVLPEYEREVEEALKK